MKIAVTTLVILVFSAFFSCATAEETFLAMSAFKSELIEKSGGSLAWSEKVPGVMTRLDTEDKILAITLDACGIHGAGYDTRLIDYLIKENIPATLFVSGLWIDQNSDALRELASVSIFEIANHGLRHKPCSINGKAASGVSGTSCRDDIAEEVEKNSAKIEKTTGKKPKYYRSGFAYYDPEGAKVVEGLGYTIVDGIFGDRRGVHSESEIREKMLSAAPGSIFMVCMDHMEEKESEAFIAAIGEMKAKGFKFVKLSDYKLK